MGIRVRTDEVAQELLTRFQNNIELTFVSDRLLNDLVEELELERVARFGQRTAMIQTLVQEVYNAVRKNKDR